MKKELTYEPVDWFNRLNKQLENLYGMPSLVGDEEGNVMTSRWMPAVDIKEEEEAYLIRADIPGVDPGDIDVSVDNGVLTIKGERKEEKEEEKAGYKRVERSRGSFYRRFTLPDNADADKVDAKSANGVLELKIAKRQSGKAKKIKVSS
jgi:HSP20 family protein